MPASARRWPGRDASGEGNVDLAGEVPWGGVGVVHQDHLQAEALTHSREDSMALDATVGRRWTRRQSSSADGGGRRYTDGIQAASEDQGRDQRRISGQIPSTDPLRSIDSSDGSHDFGPNRQAPSSVAPGCADALNLCGRG